MKITVKTGDWQTKEHEEFEIEIAPTNTIGEMKQIINNTKGIDYAPDRLRILYKGKHLQNGSSIAALGIKEKDLVVCIASAAKPSAFASSASESSCAVNALCAPSAPATTVPKPAPQFVPVPPSNLNPGDVEDLMGMSGINQSSLVSSDPKEDSEPAAIKNGGGEFKKKELLNFENLNLQDNLLMGIYCTGFEFPTEIQCKVIKAIMSGKDLIAQAKSGSGKTLAFCISALQRIDVKMNACQVIILAPNEELVYQINDVLESLSYSFDWIDNRYRILTQQSLPERTGDAYPSACSALGKIYGDGNPDITMNTIGRYPILLGTPKFLENLLARRHFEMNTDNVKLIILDEVDQILNQQSSTFEIPVPGKSIFCGEMLANKCVIPSSCQVAAFSTTLPMETLERTNLFMRSPKRILVRDSNARDVMENEMESCSICSKTFATAQARDIHTDSVHSDSIYTSGGGSGAEKEKERVGGKNIGKEKKQDHPIVPIFDLKRFIIDFPGDLSVASVARCLDDILPKIEFSACIVNIHQKVVKFGADDLFAESGYGVSTAIIHEEMSQELRSLNFKSFLSGESRVLLTSTQHGLRGVHFGHVGLLINIGVPEISDADIGCSGGREQYIHSIGRVCRRGKKGIVIDMVSGNNEIQNLNKICQFWRIAAPQHLVDLKELNELPFTGRDMIVSQRIEEVLEQSSVNETEKQTSSCTPVRDAYETLTQANIEFACSKKVVYIISLLGAPVAGHDGTNLTQYINAAAKAIGVSDVGTEVSDVRTEVSKCERALKKLRSIQREITVTSDRISSGPTVMNILACVVQGTGYDITAENGYDIKEESEDGWAWHNFKYIAALDLEGILHNNIYS